MSSCTFVPTTFSCGGLSSGRASKDSQNIRWVEQIRSTADQAAPSCPSVAIVSTELFFIATISRRASAREHDYSSKRRRRAWGRSSENCLEGVSSKTLNDCLSNPLFAVKEQIKLLAGMLRN